MPSYSPRSHSSNGHGSYTIPARSAPLPVKGGQESSTLPASTAAACLTALAALQVSLEALLAGCLHSHHLSQPVVAQSHRQLAGPEAVALCQLEDYLKDVSSCRADSDEELGLDDSARSYLFSFRETSDRKPRLSVSRRSAVRVFPFWHVLTLLCAHSSQRRSLLEPHRR